MSDRHYGIPPWEEIMSHDIRHELRGDTITFHESVCTRCGRTARDITANGGACHSPSDEIRDIQPGDGYGYGRGA